MKLIIDIPEEVYKASQIIDVKYEDVIQIPLEVIKNGTPIYGTTNGDAIISLYPNLKYTIQNGRVVTTIGVVSSFDLDWWNSPYQKGE